MQTLPNGTAADLDRPAYRPFRVRVTRVERLTPSFRQVTCTGPDLDEFGTEGLDQRVKLILPAAGAALPNLGTDDPVALNAGAWYARWLAVSADHRPAMRTYTVRRVRPGAAEVDVVLVEHEVEGGGRQGPAGDWLRRARNGDEIIVVGPDGRSPARGSGIDWRPGAASRLLLAGDETAAPAIVAILESLADRPDVTARAFVEAPSTDDALPAALSGNTRIDWLARGRLAHGRLLLPAVTAWLDAHAGLLDAAKASVPQPVEDLDVDRELLWDSPVPGDGQASFYAWIAGEAAAMKALRRAVVTDRGVDRQRVAFMGYWRQGQAERQ